MTFIVAPQRRENLVKITLRRWENGGGFYDMKG
jgi:hypothetical protein